MTHAALTRLRSPSRCVGTFKSVDALHEWHAEHLFDVREFDWASVLWHYGVRTAGYIYVWRDGQWRQ